MCIFVDKPARLIIRLLFRFDKLNQSTNSETAILSSKEVTSKATRVLTLTRLLKGKHCSARRSQGSGETTWQQNDSAKLCKRMYKILHSAIPVRDLEEEQRES